MGEREPAPDPYTGAAAGTRRPEFARLSEDVRRTLGEYPDFPRPGILFRDIAPVLASPRLLARVTACLAALAREWRAEKVAGIESRGFLLGAPVAVEVGLPFVPVRKQGKLPGETIHATCELEYGTTRLEMQTAAVRPGERILLVDDLLATGGTASAAVGLIERLGGEVAGAAFLVELSALAGRAALAGDEVFTLVEL